VTKLKKALISLFIILICASTVLNFNVAYANPSWLAGWSYRKSHVINYAAGAGTNYQKQITVHYGEGEDSDDDVYLNSHCRTDFGDVRFTDDDGSTLLDYWMETKVDSDHAVFWVEVADDLSSQNQTIYVYYGKSDATSISNGANTFLFFEDFNSYSDGDLNGQGGWSGDAGYFTVEGTTVYEGAKAVEGYTSTTVLKSIKKELSNMPNNFEIISHIRVSAINSHGGYVRVLNQNSATIGGKHMNVNNQFQVQGRTSATDGSFTNDTWYVWQLQFRESDQYERVSGDNQAFSDWVAPSKTGTPFYIRLLIYDGVVHSYFDLIFIRKYITSEPAHGSWGSEETSGAWYQAETWNTTTYTLKWFLSEVWSLINIYGNVPSYGIYTTPIFPVLLFCGFITFIFAFLLIRKRGHKNV